jgi:biopolymer transport protein ExbB/TolQ
MFADLNFWQMLQKGGITVAVLLIISIISWWIIIERTIRFSKLRIDTKDFMLKIKKLLQKKDREGAISLCQETPGPVSAVICSGLQCESDEKEKIENAMQRTLNYETERMQRYLGVLGSIGNVSPFIGLFGTVLGIIRAFHDLAMSSGGGPSVVANGIAEALVATAVGLFVAVPAVIAYNFFVRAIDNIEVEAINAASELIDILEK